jgi:hypothetical protein
MVGPSLKGRFVLNRILIFDQLMVGSKNRFLVSQSFGRASEYKHVSLTLLGFYAQIGDTDIRSMLFTDRQDWFAQILHGQPVTILPPNKY